jgi:hypothetical protein
MMYSQLAWAKLAELTSQENNPRLTDVRKDVAERIENSFQPLKLCKVVVEIYAVWVLQRHML